MINVPVSLGELLDKISILNIKEQKITDESKLANIRKERDLLLQVCIDNKIQVNPELLSALTEVNAELWMVLQKQRDLEKIGLFTYDFINWSRSVYELNDERFRLKSIANQTSEIVEEKHYN